jgi:3-oxoacyl-[acyl-carrier protein] reductase
MNRAIGVMCATSGIGQAVCERLAGSRRNLLLFGRNEEKLTSLRDRLILNRECRIETSRIDFDFGDDLRRVAAEGSTTLGSLDGLVVIYPRIAKQSTAILDAQENAEIWQRSFFGPLELVRILLDRLEPESRVVIVSGVSNMQILPSLGVSNVIRAAWLAQAKLLSFALGDRRIRVNTVSLGGTLTDRFVESLAKSPQPGPLDDQPGVIPLGEYGEPSQAAYVIETLLGDFVAHMTGANIVLDGGLSRHYL